MIRKKRMGVILLGMLLSLALVMTACGVGGTQIESTAPVINPTVLVTLVVTQIVATPTITPTPEPTKAVNIITPAVTAGWDPFTVPIYYPIGGCVASRIHEGDVAYVANGGGSLGIHYSKDIGYSPTYRLLDSGEMIDIIKGPWCADGSIIWKIAAADGVVGFASEGNGSTYWLLPMPPGTERVLDKDKLKEILQTQP